MSNTMRGKKGRLFLFLLLTILCLLPTFSSAATSPEVVRLLTLPDQGYPARVAADSAGNIYVADSFRKSVRVMTSSGSQVREVKVAYEPTMVAVSPDGNLYVGGNNGNGRGSLDVLTPAGGPVRTINADRPKSIAFLGTGEMFLLDGYVVRKFDAANNQTAQFGGYGMLPDPQALAVNEARGELYVLDMGSKTTVGGYSNTPVWRVQVFDLAGAPLRNFSNYGLGTEGKVGSASALAVDNAGRIYVSDNTQPIIVVFDENGVALKTIFDTASPLYNIVNISFTNDRLYMSSMLGKFVTVYGVDGFAQLSVDPASIDLNYQVGMPTELPLTLSNTGPGTLSWTAAADAGWLSVAPDAGQVAGNASQTGSVVIDPAKMPEGSYAGSVTFESNGGQIAVPVKVKVNAPPALSVKPGSIAIRKVLGQPATPVDLSIQITNDITGSRTWHAGIDPSAASWLAISRTDGISNMVPAPQVQVNDAPLGMYSGLITVTADGATGSPAVVVVSLEVIKPTTIKVSTSMPDAAFSISGPVKYSDTGKTSYIYNDAKAGTYTITFAALKGYQTPASQTATLAEGETISFTGNYVDLRKKVNIVASRAAGASQPAEIAIFTADGAVARRITSMPYQYGATTAVGDFDGDGNADIIAGTGGLNMPSIVKAFYNDGTPIPGLEFTAFLTRRGANVAAGDFDGDGSDEIVVGDRQKTFVRIYSYRNGSISNTGVYFEGYPRSLSGVNVAVADIDGDGAPELITTPERKDSRGIPAVNIYKIDTSAGAGKWKAVLQKHFNACAQSSATALTAGDINADAVGEILTACSGRGGAEVRVYSADGKLLKAHSSGSQAIDFVAAGDTNMDGSAEIILGDGAAVDNQSVRIMDAGSGAIINSFDAFTQSNGVGVSVGNLGY